MLMAPKKIDVCINGHRMSGNNIGLVKNAKYPGHRFCRACVVNRVSKCRRAKSKKTSQ